MHFLLPLAIAMAALLPGGAASAGVHKPTVKVTPSIVAPGGKATVAGRHWKPDAKVTVLAGPPHSGAAKIGSLKTDSAGRFRGTLTFSASVKVGRYVLVACQRHCKIKASTKFRITRTVGKPATPLTDRPPSSSGRKRVSFTLVGGGGCIPA
jgi:hypothetical protein